MNKNQLIYIASPYSSVIKETEQIRYDATLRIVSDLLKQGYHVVSPIVHCHPLSVKYEIYTQYYFWEDYNLHILEKCDLLLILKLKEWDKSVGVRAEIKYAEEVLKIPVEYYNVD